MSHHITSPTSIPTFPHHPSPNRISCTTDLKSSQHVPLNVSSPSHITSFSDIPHVPLPRCPTRILESAAANPNREKAAFAISTAGETHPGYRASKFREGVLSPPTGPLHRVARAPPLGVERSMVSKGEGIWGKVKGKFGGRKG